MTNEYLEPSRNGWLAVTSVLVVGAAALLALHHFSPAVMDPLSAMPSVCDELAGYRRLTQMGSLLLLAPGLWLTLYGVRILRSGQSPPPDAWVLHRVLVKRGAHVKRVGILLIATGVLVCLLPAYFWSDVSRLGRAEVGQLCAGM
jgi:hypothetical protein